MRLQNFLSPLWGDRELRNKAMRESAPFPSILLSPEPGGSMPATSSSDSPNHSFARRRWRWSNPISFHQEASQTHEILKSYHSPCCDAFRCVSLPQVYSTGSFRYPKTLRCTSIHVIPPRTHTTLTVALAKSGVPPSDRIANSPG